MLRRDFLKNFGWAGAATALPAAGLQASPAPLATSVRGRVHENGKGIAKVVVSDGFSVAITDAKGQYSLAAHSDAEYVFISLPAGYAIPHEKGLARFYKPLKQTSSGQSFDFALKKSAAPDLKHAFIVWADPQIWDEKDAEQLKTQSAPDTADFVKTLGNVPVHGIGCGDLVFDKFELYDDYTEAVAATGIPFFQVVGNHDMDFKTARTDDQSQSTFKELFGPTYYSFNRGKVHYVILDDVFFLGDAKRYIGYLPEAQLSWLEKDLKHVPAGSTVVVALHIPTNTGVKQRDGLKDEPIGGVVSNREHLYKLLQPYKVHIVSGHTHNNEKWSRDNMTEHVNGTVCGAWWTGPICTDGTPCGYGVYEVEGSEVKWVYKATGKPREYQVRLYPKGKSADRPEAIIANIWNWDPHWKVEWWEDGLAKGMMEQFTGLDPLAVEIGLGPDKPKKHKWVEPEKTDHLFAATPSANAREIVVKATDRFGNVYSDTMKMA